MQSTAESKLRAYEGLAWLKIFILITKTSSLVEQQMCSGRRTKRILMTKVRDRAQRIKQKFPVSCIVVF